MNAEEFRKLLLDNKAELERRLAAIERDVKNETNPVSRDSGEQSIERENDEVIDALGNSARDELRHIGHALQRIEDGEYFDCENCGEPIGEARLRSVPYATKCIECTEEDEFIDKEA